LELEEKAMATDDKIQVSRNEGSVLGTRRLWSRGFQVSKISGPWFGTWKKKGRKEEEEGMAGRTTRAAICLSVCSSLAARAARCGGPGEVPRPVWPAYRALCTPLCLSWFKETGGLHSVRRSRVPTSCIIIVLVKHWSIARAESQTNCDSPYKWHLSWIFKIRTCVPRVPNMINYMFFITVVADFSNGKWLSIQQETRPYIIGFPLGCLWSQLSISWGSWVARGQ
jgi:hypothetical protein